jgi:hypothetical protein
MEWTPLGMPWACCFNVATPLWSSVGVKPNTPKVGDFESFGTPECLKFDNKAQNTSHLGCSWCHWKVLEE